VPETILLGVIFDIGGGFVRWNNSHPALDATRRCVCLLCALSRRASDIHRDAQKFHEYTRRYRGGCVAHMCVNTWRVLRDELASF